MRCFVTASSLFFLVALARADTPVQGTIPATTWTKGNSPYRVQDTVFVPPGVTLTIERGVDVLFDADVPLVVAGSIRAEGTESDNVRFVRGLSEHWGGIWIVGGDVLPYISPSLADEAEKWDGVWATGGDSSAFAYARLSDGRRGALWVDGRDTRISLTNCVLSGNRGDVGGAIRTDRSALYLTDCRLNANRAEHGGALSVQGPTLLTSCTLSGNSASTGGAIGGVVTASSCLFANNTAYRYGGAISGGGTFTDCTFSGNSGGENGTDAVRVSASVHVKSGLFIDDRPVSETTFRRCYFIDNAAWEAPIVVNGDSLCHVTLTSCIITGNSGQRGPSAILVRGRSEPTDFPLSRRQPVVKLVNTVIADNTGSWGTAVWGDVADLTVLNCTITGNQRSWPYPGPDPGAGGQALGSGDESQAAIINSILWANGGTERFGSNVAVSYSDIMGGWEGEGNIALDPLFVDPANGDYDLQAGSPAVGAAIPHPEWPLSVRWWPNMGVIPLDYSSRGPILTHAQEPMERPAQFALYQNAPNPFNPSTTIRFAVPDAGPASLVVYTLAGQRVCTLVNTEMQAGIHSAVWDGTDASGRPVASGVYLVRLATQTNTVTQRVTLLR